MLDTLNRQQIEELMNAEQAKAEAYAAQPERFTLYALEVEVRTEHGNQLVMYNDGEWSCTCTFFEDWHLCCHILSISSLLAFCGGQPALLGG